jgi:prepilin-type N-terminal cleavage/methylation domain-containing protein
MRARAAESARRARHRSGLTLLEILAVLLIAGLLMSVMIPNLSALQSHTLHDAAAQIVERIDFGRQRAVMTGAAHRLALNLDEGTYQLEWSGARPAEPAPPAPPPLDPDAEPVVVEEPPLSLAPPPVTERSFQQLAGPLGEIELLEHGVEFAWIETPGGEVDTGEASIVFESDGTSTYTLLVLDEPGGRQLALEILPLAEAVRVLDEDF